MYYYRKYTYTWGDNMVNYANQYEAFGINEQIKSDFGSYEVAIAPKAEYQQFYRIETLVIGEVLSKQENNDA